MTTLRQALKGKLTQKEMEILRASFDVIGDIAIIEIPTALKKKEKIIAKTLLSLLKNVKVVAVKKGGHKGAYRRQKLRIIAGEKRLQTTHTESGVRLKLDVEKCYYSPRLGTERLRIARLIKKKERILVAGSGIGPYPLIIAKHSPAKEIVGVEINPIANHYAQQNILLNKLEHKVKALKGDVSKLSLGIFDRVIAAIPHKGVRLIPSLLKFTKKGTFIHVLDFAPEEDPEKPARQLVMLCNKNKRKCKIQSVVKAGTPAVRKYRVCIDARII